MFFFRKSGLIVVVAAIYAEETLLDGIEEILKNI